MRLYQFSKPLEDYLKYRMNYPLLDCTSCQSFYEAGEIRAYPCHRCYQPRFDALCDDDKLALEMYHQWQHSPIVNEADALAAVFIVHGIERPSVQASYLYNQICGICAMMDDVQLQGVVGM